MILTYPAITQASDPRFLYGNTRDSVLNNAERGAAETAISRIAHSLRKDAQDRVLSDYERALIAQALRDRYEGRVFSVQAALAYAMTLVVKGNRVEQEGDEMDADEIAYYLGRA